MQERRPRRGDVVECDVERIDERGHGVGRLGEHTVAVRGAVPGSRVRASVRRRRRLRVEAALEEVLEPSPRAAVPRCAHFGTCGGCSLQGLDYPAQLDELGRVLGELVAPLAPRRIDPVLGCAEPWHYRNKMDFTFGSRRWIEPDEPEDAPRGFALGLHVPGRFDRVLDVRSCDIAFREATPILSSARELARELGLDAWDVRGHAGLLRHLVLRKGFASGEILVVLVTTEEVPARVRPWVEGLLVRHAEVTTLVQMVNDGVALVATGREVVHHGTGVVREEVAGLRFDVSAASFFQTNTAQATELVRVVVEEAGDVRGLCVHDLYCGTGLFSLALAREGARVTGFECVEGAVADARRAAEANAIEGATFHVRDLARAPDEGSRGEDRPEVCVVDPPRGGLHPRALESLGRQRPRRIVYVSCNPKSAARDLASPALAGYEVLRVRPLDLFPHTPHLECVLTLEPFSSAREDRDSLAAPARSG